MKKLLLFLFFSAYFAHSQYQIIPKPESIVYQPGHFILDEKTQIVVAKNSDGLIDLAELFREQLKTSSGLELEIIKVDFETTKGIKGKNSIWFQLDKNLSKKTDGNYQLTILKNFISINSNSVKGCFYGLQSFLQILPSNIFNSKSNKLSKIEIQCGLIQDSPRFEYRGFMLDVGRYYFPVSSIKRMIDLMALHKMNQFHWHLTEDQGWRIEIKKYPKLTEIGSKRKESMKGHYREQKFDGLPHEGFYTQEEVKEIVKYAQKRFINVIPEIEMPGHSMAALAAYPELGCKENTTYEVSTKWSVHKDVYCPTEKTFEFLENVLSEVIDLFPSEYIHIGGDECPKDSWKASPFCQNLIKTKGLKDEHELQSYFIKRIDKFITSKGRKMIGWDEILEGGLSQNATVMSWRGEKGGIEAAKQGHKVVMSPNTYCYLDYYQSEPSTEPLAIGGNLPLEKVYNYEPFSKEMSEEQTKYILGVQGNLWTEYINTIEYAEYMAFPRLTALAEIAWSQDTKKDFPDFSKRLKKHFERLKYLGTNYSTSFNDVTAINSVNEKGQALINFKTADNESIIRFTIDGSEPTATSMAYKNEGVVLTKSAMIRTASFSKTGEKLGKEFKKNIFINKATGKFYKLINQPKRYLGGENLGLTNGIKGDEQNLNTWVGFEGSDLDLTLDLGQITEINRVSIGFLSSQSSWILLPKNVEIEISEDRITFENIQKIDVVDKLEENNSIKRIDSEIGGKKVRYIRVYAKNYGYLPNGHSGAGKPAWLFADEIEVE